MDDFDILILLKLPHVGRKTVKKILDSNCDLQFSESNNYINAISLISSKATQRLSKGEVEDSKRKAT